MCGLTSNISPFSKQCVQSECPRKSPSAIMYSGIFKHICPLFLNRAPFGHLKVDNLCRNPDLVVLVPASQEADPLDIQVTLHPRVQTPTTFTSDVPTNSSPITIGDNSPIVSPHGVRDREPKRMSAKGAGAAAPSGGGATAATTGWRRRTSPSGIGGGGKKQQSSSGGGSNGGAPGPKRRGRLSLSATRSRLTRTGSTTGGRMGRASQAPDQQSVSSWDDSQGILAPTTHGGSPSPAGERDPLNSSGRAAGGGIFASLSRRRGGDGCPRPQSGTGSSLSVTPTLPPSVSGNDGLGRRGISGAEAEWRGASSAPAQHTSRVFFAEDTDDGGEESESSNEDDGCDGPRSRRGFIKVSCTARTSYKLFSSDPQVSKEK